MGRIHINFGSLLDRNSATKIRDAATTLVHEATHRFTGTRDWAYMAEGLEAFVAAKALGTTLAMGGEIAALTNLQALNNADSYGKFVVGMP